MTAGERVAQSCTLPHRRSVVGRLRPDAGAIRLPDSEPAARDLQQQLNQRLAALAERAERLARSRTSDEKKVADVAELLRHWLTHGRPKPEREIA